MRGMGYVKEMSCVWVDVKEVIAITFCLLVYVGYKLVTFF